MGKHYKMINVSRLLDIESVWSTHEDYYRYDQDSLEDFVSFNSSSDESNNVSEGQDTTDMISLKHFFF